MPGLNPSIGDFFEGGYYAGQIVVEGISYALILCPLGSGRANERIDRFKNTSSAVPEGCRTLNDGFAATQALVADGASNVYPAAHWCNNLVVNGFSDWYLPSRDELEMCYRAFKPYTQLNRIDDRIQANFAYTEFDDESADTHGVNRHSDPPGANYTESNPAQTPLVDFQATIVGGSESLNSEAFSFAGTRYWTSTAISAPFSINSAWLQSFGDGRQYDTNVQSIRRIRAVRRVAFVPTPPPPPPPPPLTLETKLFNIPALVTSHERLVTSTAIRETRTGERRTTLRRPRLELVYEVLTSSRTFEILKSQYLTIGAGGLPTGTWQVPVLRDLVRLPATAGPGEVNLFAPNFHGDFRAGTEVLIYNPDGVQVEAKTIDSLVDLGAGGEQLILTAPTAIACNAIAPLRDALLTNGIQLTQINPHNRIAVKFVCLDDAGDFGESPFSQYEDLDLFTDPNVTAETLQHSFREDFAFIDNQSGNPEPVLLQDYFRNLLQLNIVADGGAARWRLKKWLASLNGKSKPFWFPDYSFQFELLQDITSASQQMRVKRLFGDPENFIGKRIIIEEDGEGPLVREITDVVLEESSFVIFEINSAPGRLLEFGKITVTMLRKVRLDTDEIEIYGSTFSKVNLTLWEVPE